MIEIPKIIYVHANGFLKKLQNELKFSTTIGQLTIPKQNYKESPIIYCFIQNKMLNSQTFSFKSESDIETILLSKKKDWSLINPTIHSSKIQKKLSKPFQPLKFGSKFSKDFGIWTLLNENTILYSDKCSSPFPNGEIHFIEDKKAPSRAYLKLWEILTIINSKPSSNTLHLDMGSSPGGWTYVLENMGLNILSIDKTPLTIPCKKFWKKDLFQINPKDVINEGANEESWIFCDVISTPKKVLELVHLWMSFGFKKFCVTIKFKGEIDNEQRDVLMEFSKISGSKFIHLFHNKNEVTWILI